MAERFEESIALFEKTLSLMREHLGPEHDYTLSTVREISYAYRISGQVEKAIKSYEEAIKQYPNDLGLHLSLAKILTSRVPPDNSRSQQAVEVATKATQLNPQSFVAWRLLGRARYWAGEWDSCIEAIQKSISFHQNSDAEKSLDWLFLAMAHARLGHRDEAQKWYDDATGWMDQHTPKNEDFAYLRNEAAHVLGITNPQSLTKPQHHASVDSDTATSNEK
jgi:tetratricopeptide (TPR) repeat protein